MTPDVRERIMRFADSINISPSAGYASPDAFLSGLVPTQPIAPLPEPIPLEITWKMVQDVGHEEDAYYKLGWRCISRHGNHALLCKDFPEADAPLEFLIMVAQ